MKNVNCKHLLSLTLALISINALTACGSVTPGTGGVGMKALGAKSLCASSGKNAFDTYGASAFLTVNSNIFTNVNSELAANGQANLGNSFSKVGTGAPNTSTADNFTQFKGNLAAFLVFTYGGPSSITYTDGNDYVGPQDMAISHQGLAITAAQFNYFVSNSVVPALTAAGVPNGDVSSCFAPAITSSTFMAAVVGQ